jgi:WD40 repeat protein
VELALADRLQLEAWLAEFDEAWNEQLLAARVGRLPPPGQPLRLAALIELVKIDLERNWQNNRHLSLADYLARYPELGPAEALPPDLLLAEEEVCRQFGEVPATHRVPAAGAEAGQPMLPRPLSPAASRVPCVRGYEVLGKLGQGGMGAVYKAHHLRLNRVVALKVVGEAPNARPEDLVRFRQEAELIARLHHPNVVQIYEVGEYPGGSYLALEYVDGPALDRQVNGTPQPPRQAAQLVETLARAVHYAHGQGIVHRDLKPANVLLTSAGAPKITDFGLARLVELESGLTTDGAIMGTPNYMAPEQADARLKDVGPHTDTYALGAILYECLTGRPPFRGATVLDTLDQVRQQDPVPPHRLLGSKRRACPADLETICLKCLEKEPQRRYASAGALADDLGRYLAGEPIAARPVGPAGRAWRWARRNPGWAAMLATVAGLLLLIAIGSSLMSLWLGQALQQSRDEKRKADENLWVALLEQARAKSRSRERGQRFEGLAAIRQALRLQKPPGHSLAELRNEAIACLVLPDVEPAGAWWEGWPTGTDWVAFDPTFERYARADKDGTVLVRRVADDAKLLKCEGWGRLVFGGLSFSPDGRFLQHRCFPASRLKVYRLDGRTAEVVCEAVSVPEGLTVAFSPDGRSLAAGQADGSVVIYDLPVAGKAKEVQRLRTGLGLYVLAFRPGQAHLAVAGGNVVHIFDLEKGKGLFRDLSHPARTHVDCIAWHPDGRTLATTCSDRRIRLWDVVAGKMSLPPLAGHHSGGMVAAFSPTGDCLLSNDWSRTLRLWDLRTGRQLLQTQSTADVLSRDGDLLAADRSESRVRLLRVVTRRPLRALAPPGESGERRVLDARVSPDGRLLLVTRSDALALLDWASGAELDSIPLHLTYVVGFDSQEGLLTSGRNGLLRWPLRPEPEAGRLHVGPPQSLSGAPITGAPRCSPDGQVVAFPAFGRGAVVLHRPENRRTQLGPREDVRQDVRHCAVSPDRRWVATGNHTSLEGKGATVWDVGRAKAVKDFPVDGLCDVSFSPDRKCKWLLTTGGRFRLWKVGTWEEGPSLAQPDVGGDGFAFSPDGRTLALFGGFSQVWLVDVDSGAEIARLTVPEQTRVAPRCFSSDGAQLVAIGVESNLLYIWDLRALRAELKKLDLDWDRPDYPPAPAATPPLEVRVEGGDLLKRAEATRLFIQANKHSAAGNHAQALAALRQAVQADPGYGVAHNNLARLLLTGPKELRDPKEALPHARKAVELSPERATYHYTLGVALYRSDRFAEAVPVLEKSLKEGKREADAFDLFFLAMCQQRLGHAAAARDCFDRAVAWRKVQRNLRPSWVRELEAFEAEAREALGLPGQAKP